MKGGIYKPVLDAADDTSDLLMFKGDPGLAITFNDKFLHRAAINWGNDTRVSLGFTMFVKP